MFFAPFSNPSGARGSVAGMKILNFGSETAGLLVKFQWSPFPRNKARKVLKKSEKSDNIWGVFLCKVRAEKQNEKFWDFSFCTFSDLRFQQRTNCDGWGRMASDNVHVLFFGRTVSAFFWNIFCLQLEACLLLTVERLCLQLFLAICVYK